jgi:aminopeptidase N
MKTGKFHSSLKQMARKMLLKFLIVFLTFLCVLRSISSKNLVKVKIRNHLKIKSLPNEILFPNRTLVSRDNPFKLPENLIPTKYEIFLKTAIDEGNFEYSGTTKIVIKAIESTSIIKLHSKELDILRVDLLDLETSQSISNTNFSFDLNKDFLIIPSPFNLMKDKLYQVEIRFRGVLRDDSLGFNRLSYTDFNNNTIWIAATFFEPVYARYVFPCFDEPSIRAIFSLKIQHASSYHSLSNMPVTTRTIVAGTSDVITSFAESPPMQTYLFAFVVSNMKHTSNNNTKTPQRIFAQPSLIDSGQGDFVVQKVDAILRLFEEYFGVSFTLPKLDHVALPNYGSRKVEGTTVT